LKANQEASNESEFVYQQAPYHLKISFFVIVKMFSFSCLQVISLLTWINPCMWQISVIIYLTVGLSKQSVADRLSG